MRAPLFTVVVPAYNAERTLLATVDSVLAQTVDDLEVVIVDDGSTDGTLGVAGAIEDPRVRVIGQPNGGASAARNAGIKAATGTYVAFVDSDDLWLRHKLERQLEVLDANPEVSAVQTGVFRVDDDLRVLYAHPCTQPNDPLWDTLLFRNMPAFPTTLVVKRSRFDEIGMFDTSLVILEDWEMAIRTCRYCNLTSIEEPLALYRVHPGNRSRDLDVHVEPGFEVLSRLFADPELPRHIRRRKRVVYGRFYTMLAGGAFKVRSWRPCAKWAARALVADPRTIGYMAQLPARRMQRRRSRRTDHSGRLTESPTLPSGP